MVESFDKIGKAKYGLCCQYHTTRYDMIQYNTAGAGGYDTIQYSTVRYDTIRYDMIHDFASKKYRYLQSRIYG